MTSFLSLTLRASFTQCGANTFAYCGMLRDIAAIGRTSRTAAYSAAIGVRAGVKRSLRLYIYATLFVK